MSNADELVEELTLAVNDACSAWELGRHTLAHDRRIDAAKKAVVDALNAALRDSARLDWLNTRCEEISDTQVVDWRGEDDPILAQTLYGYGFGVYGQTSDVREAIDAAVAGSGLSDPERHNG